MKKITLCTLLAMLAFSGIEKEESHKISRADIDLLAIEKTRKINEDYRNLVDSLSIDSLNQWRDRYNFKKKKASVMKRGDFKEVNELYLTYIVAARNARDRYQLGNRQEDRQEALSHIREAMEIRPAGVFNEALVYMLEQLTQ
jgi:hypothetical protein